jgi:hypothetical protein
LGLCGGLEGDFVAEGLELADVVTHLAVEVDSGVVVVGAQVVELGVVVAEQVPSNDQDGSADRDDGSLIAGPAGDLAVPLTEKGVRACR